MLSGWNYRQKITIDSTGAGLSGDLTDFTITVHVPSSNTGFWAGVKADGTDVRFTAADGATLLNFEVESFDSTGDDAWYQVKVPSVTAATNPDIYIYYGNASASSGEDINNTWDANFKGVWHLNQDKAAGAFADSTSNANHGTNSGSTDAVGKIDRGRAFDGSQFITIPDAASLSFAGGSPDVPITVTAWINMTDATGFRIFTKGNATNHEYAFNTNGADKLYFWLADNSPNNTEGQLSTGALTADEGSLIFVAATYDGSGASTGTVLYKNGASIASSPADFGVYSSMKDTTADAYIGKLITGAEYYATGIIDEVTVSNVARSADWLKARYQSGLGTWLAFGAEEVFFAGITDTGSAAEAVSVSVVVAVSDTVSGADMVGLATKGLTIDDTGAGSDAVDFYNGEQYSAADSAAGSDDLSLRVLVTVADSASGLDVMSLNTPAVLLLAVIGFPSDQTVEYQILDGDLNTVQDWTATGVFEKALGGGGSVYRVWREKFTNAIVNWRIPSTVYKASEVIDIYRSNSDVANSTRLANCDYAAPDNAGIASALSLIQSFDKWKNNKLKRTAVNGSVETWVLYDDDGSTPMLTWTHDTATMTRNKAT